MGQSYRDLFAWQKAMRFVIEIYKITRSFPQEETFGLAAQLRRTAVIIPTSIADGQARYSPHEFFSYLGRARGALVEVETELILCAELDYLTTEQSENLLGMAAEVGKILNGLVSAIRPAA